MRILAIESSAKAASIAVTENGSLVSQFFQSSALTHSRTLLCMAQDLLSNLELKLSDIDSIAVAKGPGSFTGVRVAVSAAQGLALGLDIPLTGVSSLAALAQGALKEQPDAKLALSAIDARMGEVYFALFAKSVQGLQVLYEESVLSPEAASAKVQELISEQRVVTAGTGIELLRAAGLNCAAPAVLFPDPCSIIELGQEYIAQGWICDAQAAQPVYIRNEVTWKKLDQQGKAH